MIVRKRFLLSTTLLLFASRAASQTCFQATDGGREGVLYNSIRLYVMGDSTVRSTYGQLIGNWCVDAVTDMSFLFLDLATFNEPLDNWNVANAVNMNGMVSAGRLEL